MQFGGWAAGGQLMRIDDPLSTGIFVAGAGVVFIVGMLPLLVVAREPPPREDTAPGSTRPAEPMPSGMDLAGLYRTSPIGFVAVILVGGVNGPFWTLTPVYATDIGLTAVAAGTLMTVITIGAAALQFPVGRVSDLIDRRIVLVALTVIAAAVEFAYWLFGQQLVGWPLLALGFVLGGMIGTQYYTAAAHANDRAGPERAISLSAALLFLYSIGAITGPLTASFAMQAFGPGALYLHNMALHLALAIFVVLRMRLREPATPQQDQVAIERLPVEGRS
jgi:MFS family permease